jgi:hypothetical protein
MPDQRQNAAITQQTEQELRTEGEALRNAKAPTAPSYLTHRCVINS